MWKLLAKQIVQYRCAHNDVDASETAITAQRQGRQCRPPASSICFCVCFFKKKNFAFSCCFCAFLLLPFMCALSLSCVLTPSCGPPSPFSCTLGVWRKDNMRKKFVIEQLKRRTTQPQLSRRRRRTLGEESRKTKTIVEYLCL